jgi:hypothetical protein
MGFFGARSIRSLLIHQQPSNIKAPFFEQFTDDWESRWSPSHAKKEDSKTTEEWAYVGEWAVEEPHVLPAIVGDKGLVVKNPAAHHAISAKFDAKVDNKGKTLVVQYEVKLQSEGHWLTIDYACANIVMQTAWSVVAPT